MIFAALLLAAAPVPIDGPTALESAAVCRASTKSEDPNFLERLMDEVGHTDAEKAQLRRECVIYLTGKRDAYEEIRGEIAAARSRARRSPSPRPR